MPLRCACPFTSSCTRRCRRTGGPSSAKGSAKANRDASPSRRGPAAFRRTPRKALRNCLSRPVGGYRSALPVGTSRAPRTRGRRMLSRSMPCRHPARCSRGVARSLRAWWACPRSRSSDRSARSFEQSTSHQLALGMQLGDRPHSAQRKRIGVHTGHEGRVPGPGSEPAPHEGHIRGNRKLEPCFGPERETRQGAQSRENQRAVEVLGSVPNDVKNPAPKDVLIGAAARDDGKDPLG